MKKLLIKCSHCDYSQELVTECNYYYENIPTPKYNPKYKFKLYPRIYNAYCNDCKKEVFIQEGIDAAVLTKEAAMALGEKLGTSKLFSKKKFNYFTDLYNHYKSIQMELMFKNSLSTCLECGGTNIVYKEGDIWACPKCDNILQRQVVDYYDNNLFVPIKWINIGARDIQDVGFCNRILCCVADLIGNERAFYKSKGRSEKYQNVEKNLEIAAIDRIAYILSILTISASNQDVAKLTSLTDSLNSFADYVSQIIVIDRDIARARLAERYGYFEKMIKFNMTAKFPSPTAIAMALLNPQEKTHRQVMDLELMHYDTIIIQTINSYHLWELDLWASLEELQRRSFPAKPLLKDNPIQSNIAEKGPSVPLESNIAVDIRAIPTMEDGSIDYDAIEDPQQFIDLYGKDLSIDEVVEDVTSVRDGAQQNVERLRNEVASAKTPNERKSLRDQINIESKRVAKYQAILDVLNAKSPNLFDDVL